MKKFSFALVAALSIFATSNLISTQSADAYPMHGYRMEHHFHNFGGFHRRPHFGRFCW